MEFLVYKQGFYFSGKWEDLLKVLAGYPPQTTLQELIRLRLS